MTEWIEQDKKDENHLYVHLKDPSLLDLSIFDRMSNDDICLPCMLTNEKKCIHCLCDRRLYSFT